MPLETMTKTSTVTNTKLLVATAALAAAGGLAFMLAPPGSYRAYHATNTATNRVRASRPTGFTGVVPAYTGYSMSPTSTTSTPATSTPTMANASSPTAPLVNTHSTSTLAVTIGGGDANSSSTVYAIREETTRRFVQADGTLKASPNYLAPYGAAVYQTTANWGTVLVSGLKPNTHYIFDVDAKNANDVHSGWGPTTGRYTAANTPTAPVVNGATSTTLAVAIGNGDGNPPETTYAISEKTSNRFVQADGSLNTFAVYNTKASWGATTVIGLHASTTYTFAVYAVNGENLFAGSSPLVNASTK